MAILLTHLSTNIRKRGSWGTNRHRLGKFSIYREQVATSRTVIQRCEAVTLSCHHLKNAVVLPKAEGSKHKTTSNFKNVHI